MNKEYELLCIYLKYSKNFSVKLYNMAHTDKSNQIFIELLDSSVLIGDFIWSFNMEDFTINKLIYSISLNSESNLLDSNKVHLLLLEELKFGIREQRLNSILQ